MEVPFDSSSAWVNLAASLIVLLATGLLSTIGLLVRGTVRRAIDRVDRMDDTVRDLTTKVAILLDRDRQARLADYSNGQ